MKKYITIAGAVLLGNVAAQAEDIEVEAAPYYNPLAKTEYQLKEQAYLEALQKIYGTSVQSGNPLSDLGREMKQQTYLSGMQNIYGHYNVQSPKVQGGDPLSDVEREMKQQAYLSGMQNIYGHYANVQSPQWGYYDPLYQQQHQLKEQAYLETMQKIYGTKVQQGNPLEDVEREMKQQAYLSGMQNIYGHYNVQAPNPYYDPLYQQKHQLKEQAYLETMQKIYGPSVQSWFSQALDFITRRQEQRQSHRRRDDDDDDDDDYKPKTPQDRQMEQLDQLKEIYGIEDPFKQTHHNKPVHHKQETDQNQDSETDSDMKPMTPSEKTQMFSNALNKIYGVKPDQKPYKPVDQETFQKQQSDFKHNAYKKTLEKIYGKKIDKDDKTGKYDVVDWDSDYKPRRHRRNQTATVESDDEE